MTKSLSQPIKDKKGRKKRTTRGTVNRSEIIHTRLSPRLRFMAELMARHQRRTLSSLIEQLVEAAGQSYSLPLVFSAEAQSHHYLLSGYPLENVSLVEAGNRLWSEDEVERFAALALFAPHLLTSQETQVWKLVKDTPYFWNHFKINLESKTGKIIDKQWWPLVDHFGLITERVREHWPLLRDILEERQSAEVFKKLELGDGQLIDQPDYYPYLVKAVEVKEP
jgi:hypothetical protein